MEEEIELGQTVNVIGGVEGAAVTGICIWRTLSKPQPTTHYELRLGDKTFIVSAAEIIPKHPAAAEYVGE